MIYTEEDGENEAGNFLPYDFCDRGVIVDSDFLSILCRRRELWLFKVLETAKEVYLNRKAHVGTSKLNEVMLPIIEANPPQSLKGKYIKIKYCTQLPNTQIPSFVFYANLPQYVKENYRRFLENKIRETWSMHGCPINIFIRQK